MTHTLARITVATDLSARSDRAVERAFHLAEHLNLPVTALLVLDNAMPEDLLSPLHEKAELQLHAMCARLAQGSDFTISVQMGDPTEELVKIAEPADRTLLVMGPHRPRPFLDTLRETTMQRVVRRTAAPVLLVTDPVTAPYRKVVSMVDFNPASTGAMTLAAELAPDASITPTHAVHVPYSGILETTSSVQGELNHSLKAEATRDEHIWRRNLGTLNDRLAPTQIVAASPETVVNEATRDGTVDLLTAGAHGAVGDARQVFGTVASELMRNPPCDVLIAR